MTSEVDSVSSNALYKDRPEWRNVKPIYNREEEEAVIRIAASEKFTDAFAYLRAVLNTNEMSERAFQLTKDCAMLNAANYSVWQYRRNILKALKKDIGEELKFCEESTLENPKNYQVWHHRKVLIEMCNDSSVELDFTALLLDDDPKNYHAWQYRQWVVEKFDLFLTERNDELGFATKCILEDLRNNSAWNYRYFVMNNLTKGFTDKRELVDADIQFTLHCIKKISNNESAWSYLAGLLVRDGLTSCQKVNEFCESLLNDEPRSKSIHLRNFMIDCIIERLEKCSERGVDVAANIARAKELLNELEQLDPLRMKYWRYRRTYVENECRFLDITK